MPTEFLDDILRKKSFSCPHCQLLQTLSRDALSYIERRFQAHLRRHGLQAPGRSSHVHPPQPPVLSLPHLLSAKERGVLMLEWGAWRPLSFIVCLGCVFHVCMEERCGLAFEGTG